MAKQRSHVPKFGNWDGENIPYTAYFENARQEKASSARMNPNDPEENPEAFMLAEFGNGSYSGSPSIPASVQSIRDKSTSAEKYISEDLKQNTGHRRTTSDRQKSPSQKSITSESGCEKSNSDHSMLHPPNRRRKKSDCKKNMSEMSNGFFQPSVGSMKSMSGINPSDDLSCRSAPIPKFGAWDERDPKSGESFTVIFNKLKEEKQTAAAKFPPVEPQISRNSVGERNGTKSKMFCCLF